MEVNSAERWWLRSLVFGLLMLALTPAMAQVTVIIDLPNFKAEANIHLPNPGGGFYDADLELEFHEGVQNLTEACLGISAQVLQGAALAAVEARLPLAPGNYAIDPNFPVLIAVEPPSGCGLEFTDDVHFEIDTPELVFTAPSAYRLMKAPIAAGFREITSDIQAGSVRTRGSGGRFSEFVIAKALISDAPAEADLGFDDLQARLAQTDLSLLARRLLDVHFRRARAAYDNADYAGAIANISALEVDNESLGGAAIPNRWRSLRDLVNAEGEIQGLAAALRHRIQRVIDAGP